MNIKKVITEIIAPEANHLLLEPPVPGDFGWFCREHSTILSAVLTLKRQDVRIVYGDVTIYIPNAIGMTTKTEPEFKHYWCELPQSPIADISLTVRYLTDSVKLNEPILGLEKNGDFMVELIETNIHQFMRTDSPIISYEIIDRNPEVQMELESAQISARISLHILDILEGKSCSLGNLDQMDALSLLRNKYPDAMEQLTNQLRNNTQPRSENTK